MEKASHTGLVKALPDEACGFLPFRKTFSTVSLCSLHTLIAKLTIFIQNAVDCTVGVLRVICQLAYLKLPSKNDGPPRCLSTRFSNQQITCFVVMSSAILPLCF